MSSETQALLSHENRHGFEGEIKPGPDAKHPYYRRLMGCPCPAIATMINHSYLNPQDDKEKLPFMAFVQALRDCYNFSLPFAFLFVFLANLRLGTLRQGGFSLEALKNHGVLEHDASITRYDEQDGDHLGPQPELIDEFLKSSNHLTNLEEGPKMVTLHDYAEKRVQLERKITSYLPTQPKYRVRLLGVGEAALALLAFREKNSALTGNEVCAREEWLRVWYHEERLPVELGWKNRRSGHKMGIVGFGRICHQIHKRMKMIESAVW
ncbi:hypothetical protein O181_078103 [Austropuccinia psidii MF-1]|uniref:Heme haloperoxidase family profile domain-containing protein n=1 Tax=Austropuccinia psidii MF-1 TaxID=1389203 RepID=A0A9Q3IEB8_9BASI|nr:hypothetical protein [Austropuccinia psidii MF-1]